MADQFRDHWRARTALRKGGTITRYLGNGCCYLVCQREGIVFQEKAANSPEVEGGEKVGEIQVQDEALPFVDFCVAANPAPFSKSIRHGFRVEVLFNLGEACVENMRKMSLEFFEFWDRGFDDPFAARLLWNFEFCILRRWRCLMND